MSFKKLPLLSFFYLIIYANIMLLVFMSANQFTTWLLIEIIIFLFIGVMFKDSVHNSSFIIYFIIQRFASIMILISLFVSSICFWSVYLFHLFVLIKLAIFPLFLWYYNVLYNLSSFSLFIVLSPQKFPVFMLVYLFNNTQLTFLPSIFNTVLPFILLSVLVSSLGGLVVTDLKRMLIWSSFSSSSWIYLSCFVSIVSLLFYFLIYSILLIGFMIFTNWLAKSFTPFSKKVLMLILFSIIGLPPFPLFFAKLMIILSTLILFSHFYFISIFILFLLIFSVILILLYFRAIINLILF